MDESRFFPAAGDLVVFPGWLRHRVSAQPGAVAGGERVAWSFNVYAASSMGGSAHTAV